MIKVENLKMEFDLNRGKVRSFKEKIFASSIKKKLKKRSFKALDGINFEINEGEIFGIIGRNGAGKSTLLKILAGIMKPTEGKVEISGKIAPMIELGTGFDYELSAYENIYLSSAVLGFDKEFIDSKIDEIFEFAQLIDFRDVPVKYFSSGMIARLAFSISTIVVPDILIVDEILSVGDLEFQKKSYKRMMELMTNGCTVIYVSHDIDSVRELCDNVLWIEKGKMKMKGQTDKVCDSFIKSI